MILTDVAERWEDPCFLWDDNGEAYLGCSKWGGLAYERNRYGYERYQ